VRSILLTLICAAISVTASAQDRKWEIEGSGAIAAGQAGSAGSLSLPAPGAPIVTSTPTFPSRETSSWFFGDGAALLNGALADFTRSARITPLDTAFAPLPAARVAAFGVRVRRALRPRTSLEISVEAMPGSLKKDAVGAAIEQSRATFVQAFTDLFQSGPFTSIAVDATGSASAASYRETALTIGFNSDLDRIGPFVPYLTFAGGVLAGSGTLPSAALHGRYRVVILGEVPIGEDDQVAVRYSRKTSPAGVLGGGLRHDLGDAWRLRIDVRVLIAPDTTRVHLDAAPASVRTGPSGFIESFTNPAVQFSNDPSTGRRSSLSAAALHDVEVFSGGYFARTLVGVAISRRF
jgi:hypothetical protein